MTTKKVKQGRVLTQFQKIKGAVSAKYNMTKLYAGNRYKNSYKLMQEENCFMQE